MRSEDQARIAIADAQPIFRLGAASLLARQPGFEVVGEGGDTADALEMVAGLHPDILLVDHSTRVNALEVLRGITATGSQTRVIVISADMSEAEIQTALLLGAWGVFMKGTASAMLPDCIRQVMRGDHWIGLESVGALVDSLRFPAVPGASLTPREVEIVRRVARGASNKEMAAKLDVGEQTVKNYLRRIFQKLQVGNRVELAILAVEHEPAMPDDTVPGGLPAASS